MQILGPVPCLKCMYELDGLLPDQKCPECGADTAPSVAAAESMPTRRVTALRSALFDTGIAMACGPVALLPLVRTVGDRQDSAAEPIDFGWMAMAMFSFLFASLFPLLSLYGWRTLAGLQQADGSRPVTWLKRSSTVFAALAIWTAACALLAHAGNTMVTVALVSGLAMLGAWMTRTFIGVGLVIDVLRPLERRGLIVPGVLIRWFLPLAAVPCVAALVLHFAAARPDSTLSDVAQLCLALAIVAIVAAVSLACIWLLTIRTHLRFYLILAEARERRISSD
ncbi:MAG: hypothetical protein KF699_16360 [Phycisphaeraceae bacterium]|nr:hypothetical protein [Phycisphaeraceae bacterium]MBX3407037.1 hypothetical protein [Phycisphaeraceae bacterium]